MNPCCSTLETQLARLLAQKILKRLMSKAPLAPKHPPPLHRPWLGKHRPCRGSRSRSNIVAPPGCWPHTERCEPVGGPRPHLRVVEPAGRYISPQTFSTGNESANGFTRPLEMPWIKPCSQLIVSTTQLKPMTFGNPDLKSHRSQWPWRLPWLPRLPEPSQFNCCVVQLQL